MVRGDRIKVWDSFVRVFHWALAACVLVAYFSEGEPASLHTTAGYIALGLVAARLVWGFVGTWHAQFRSFVTGPGAAARYLLAELRGGARRHFGHNPAGGLMVVAMLVMITATGIAGMSLYAAHDGAGPLASLIPQSERFEEPLEEVHEVLANTTIFLVLLHLAGVALGSLRHRENLVFAMIHGYKRTDSADSRPADDTRG